MIIALDGNPNFTLMFPTPYLIFTIASMLSTDSHQMSSRAARATRRIFAKNAEFDRMESVRYERVAHRALYLAFALQLITFIVTVTLIILNSISFQPRLPMWRFLLVAGIGTITAAFTWIGARNYLSISANHALRSDRWILLYSQVLSGAPIDSFALALLAEPLANTQNKGRNQESVGITQYQLVAGYWVMQQFDQGKVIYAIPEEWKFSLDESQGISDKDQGISILRPSRTLKRWTSST
jgi:hypothetical protein